MPRRDPDAVVIGSGPNGLVAAATLAKRGLSVLVVEANPRRPGGALGSEEATLPGFVHDVGASFFPFARWSPAFRHLELERHVELAHAPIESCHPAPDGSVACITRDPAREHAFGSARDHEAWRRLAAFHAAIEPRLYPALLEPFPSFGALLRLGLPALLRLGALFSRSGRSLARSLFETEAARRVVPGLALHADVGPDDPFGAPVGYVLALGATTGGYPVAVGGAQRFSDALVRVLESYGGRVRLGARVTNVLVERGAAIGVRLAGGDEIRARMVLADTGAPSLLLDLLPEAEVPGRLRAAMRRFQHGFGTFKVDWALGGEVPWRAEEAARSAVVHAGDSLDDLSRFTREVRAGRAPEHPYLVIGQQSLCDPSRAPEGQATLWAYTHVPSTLPGGWEALRESYADTIEARIEGLAPGFRSRIRARRVVTPDDLFRMDENLVGGDIGGGSAAWNKQLLFRPAFPWFRYRMPVRGVYLCSSYAHPGGGVHGMCGYNAARIAARDAGLA
ncbi:MAG: NAD(P)/FAD-dependent oxidoreductase [Deltaproteobacteria bacterium]|nr:NAD(P)/FAD-dependent oxidoreductase [Deltaproteobacteria bacterium]